MNRTHPWHGVLVATALPFTDDLKVDFDSYAEHVGWLAENGVDGVVPNGSLGEYQTLTPDERIGVVRAAVEAGGDDFVVMPGVGAYGALESRRCAEEAAEAGAKAVMALPPNSYRADFNAVLEHFREINKAGLPVTAYNNPIDTKTDLIPETLAALYNEGLIVGVKEFTGDVRRAYEISELAPGLDLMIGSDDVVLEVGLAGAVGWVAGYTNAFPKATVELYERLSDPGRGEGAAALSAASSAAALGLQDRVRPGDQAVDGHRRPQGRPLPAAEAAATPGAGAASAGRHERRCSRPD